MDNPFARGTRYAYYFDQLMNRKRPPTNEQLRVKAEYKFGVDISDVSIRVFRSKLGSGTLTGTQYDVPSSEPRKAGSSV